MIPTLLFTAYLVYGFPLLLLYIIITVQLFNKPFSSSFFILAKIQAIIDITGYMNFFFHFKAPLCPLFGYLYADIPPSFLLSVSYFYRFYSEHCHYLFVTFASFNRLTAIAFPSEHDKIWKNGIWICIAFSFVIPFLSNWHLLFSTVMVIEFTPGNAGYYSFIYENTPIRPSLALLETITFSTTGILTLTSNLISLFILIRKNLKRQNLSSNKNFKRYCRKIESGLFAVAIGDLLTMLSSVYTMINLFMLRNDYNNPMYDFYYLQIPWISDLVYLSRSILLMTLSTNVRKAVGKVFHCCDFRKNNQIFVVMFVSKTQIN